MTDQTKDTLFDRFEALTFDDVVIIPGYSDVLPDTADTSATFADDIVLQVPIVSAAMAVSYTHLTLPTKRIV